jgi:hypothetical protein
MIKMEITIRTWSYPENEHILLCEHIDIVGKIENDSSEYEEEMKIFCNVCKVEHIVTILVN